VTLGVSGLPSGVTGTFAPTTLTPSGLSVLTLSAAADAATGGPFTITITASGGGISHTTQPSVTVNFGLVPLCFGAFSGLVTDATTGLAIPTATVILRGPIDIEATVDSSGRYTFSDVGLSGGNAPTTYSLSASDSFGGGHFGVTVSAVATCGAVTTVNFQLTAPSYGTVAGTVFEGIPDPNDLSATRAVTSSGIPLSGVTVDNSQAATGADGRYQTVPLFIENGVSATWGINAAATGFWRASRQVTVTPNQTTTADFLLVRKCFATLTVTVIDQASRLPVPGVVISAGGRDDGPPQGTTDANGVATFSAAPLGYNNSQTVYSVSFFGDAVHKSASGQVTLSHCGDSVSATLELPVNPPTPTPTATPVHNFADLHGRVLDIDSGAPLPGISVQVQIVASGAQCAGDRDDTLTDASGAYSFHVDLGSTQTSGDFCVFGRDRFNNLYYQPWEAPADSPYQLQVLQRVTLKAGTSTSAADIHLLHRRFGAIGGTVRDAASH